MANYNFPKLTSVAILFLHFLCQSKGHFLSVEDLEEFYDLEEKLATTFTTYIEEQKQILEVVKKRYEEHMRWQPKINNTDEYLSNPLNVHALLKRLVTDWPLTLALLGGSFADEEEEPVSLPNLEEYYAAVHGIARIQLVYRYGMKKMITGSVFPHTDNTSLLTADDCLAVGKDLYDSQHYWLAILWFKESLAQATNESEGDKVVATSKSDKAHVSPPLEYIYEYLALATCFTGDHKESKKYFKKLYTEYPEFRPTQSLIKDHLLAVNDSCTKLIDNESLKPIVHKLKLSWKEDAELSANYSKLCRTETVANASRSLSCRLVHRGSPYLRLQPLKVEELHRGPDVYMTHNIVSPAERQYFMDNMMDEENMSMDGFVYEFWQPLPTNSTMSESLVRRTEMIAPRTTVHNTRKQTYLASYPPGGEYVITADMTQVKEPETYRLGGTVYYLQEPQAGGYTVFPRLGMSVAPVAGAALTWFNVNRKGKIYEKSVYGRCPVIKGHQTTLTMWFKRGLGGKSVFHV